MSVESLVKELGIDKVGTYGRNDSYTIDIDSSDEFGKIYSKLDNNDNLLFLDESSTVTLTDTTLLYKYGDEYQIALMSNLDQDTYKLVITRI